MTDYDGRRIFLINLKKNIEVKIKEAIKAGLINPKENRASVILRLINLEISELVKFKSFKEITEELNKDFGLNIKSNSLQQAYGRSLNKSKTEIIKVRSEIGNKDSNPSKKEKDSSNWIEQLNVSRHFKNVVENSKITKEEFESLNLNLRDQVNSLGEVNKFIERRNSLGNHLYIDKEK